MTKKEIKNYGKSVRTRLLTVSKESGIPYMTVLVRYFQERLLYRVSQSEFKENFYLKGGMTETGIQRFLEKQSGTPLPIERLFILRIIHFSMMSSIPIQAVLPDGMVS